MTQRYVAEMDATVSALVATANLEVIPLIGAQEKVLAAPAGTTITITCSPKFGLERSLEHITSAVQAGYSVVPHLAARMVSTDRDLREFVARICDMGVTDLYVIGGDGHEPAGPYLLDQVPPKAARNDWKPRSRPCLPTRATASRDRNSPHRRPPEHRGSSPFHVQPDRRERRHLLCQSPERLAGMSASNDDL